ncbi:hypothetical protein PF008_g31926 [Phytophthora fragariae]|uniref:Uncharacterized protein n=1 Tax=Phytophthora fragariae TaxID=53985 RepID=A0A6G0Q200_9STRA|nr:hypothetical protein PF003_g41076 [Phytophthora fragariae]KAE9265175.1 hypothetical protein PF008_g31926 [Phytophthora fragariae]
MDAATDYAPEGKAARPSRKPHRPSWTSELEEQASRRH